MLESDLSRGPGAERRQLLFLAIGLAGVGGGTWWLFDRRALGVVMLILAGVALSGFIGYAAIGHRVFLSFSMVTLVIGRAVSWLVVLLLYVVMVAGLGSALRLFGVNRLDRDFDRCKRKVSMLVDVLPLDPESFRRQS